MKKFEWQKIETAPKNDVIVLTDGGMLCQGFYQDGEWLTGFNQIDFGFRLTLRFHPTHWMPLPEAPKDAE